MTDPLIGTVLKDSYRIDSLLVDGGMSRIYVGHQLSLSRRVAIKMLLPGYDDEDFIALFLREARVYSQINHPNVVAVIDFGRNSDGLVFLVMEYLDGVTLADLLEQQGPLKLANVMWLMEQISAGIHAAHKQAIVHRDLKPNNIMLARMGGDVSVAKVLDFGISKPLSEEDLRNTTLGMVMGTPGYLAPEQIEGRRDIDQRADIYALGALLYFMVTGQRPFRGGNRDLIMNKQLSSLPPPLQDAKRVDPACLALQGVIDQAMAIKRDERIATVKDFWQALLSAGQVHQKAGGADATVVQAPGRFQIVVTGELEACADPENAKQRLAGALKLSHEQAADLFSGQPRIFRKHLSEKDAERYAVLFRKVGVVSRVEAMPTRLPDNAALAGASSLPTAIMVEPVVLQPEEPVTPVVDADAEQQTPDRPLDDLLASIRRPAEQPKRSVGIWLGALVLIVLASGLAYWFSPTQRTLRAFDASAASHQIEQMVSLANQAVSLGVNTQDVMDQTVERVLEHTHGLDEREGVQVAYTWLNDQVAVNPHLLTHSQPLAELFENLTVDAWMQRWLNEGQANFQTLETFVSEHPAADVPVRIAKGLHGYLPVDRRAALYAEALSRGYEPEESIFTDLTNALRRIKPASGDERAYDVLLTYYQEATAGWLTTMLASHSAIDVLHALKLLEKMGDSRVQEPYFQALQALSMGYSSAEQAAAGLAYFKQLDVPAQRDQVLGLHDWLVKPKSQVSRWNYRGLQYVREHVDLLRMAWSDRPDQPS